MNYANIKYCDIANGPGVRTSLFVSGCRHHCPGCFNEVAWDFGSGLPFTAQTEEEILSSLRPGYIKGLSLLGGEPLEPENQEALLSLLRRVRQELPKRTVWCYTGFLYEDLSDPSCRACTGSIRELLSLIDVLVDGPFLMGEKDISLRFRGSRNQRLLDLRRTEAAGHPVLWQDAEIYTSHTMPADRRSRQGM